MAAPQESVDALNNERYFLSSDFISGVGYGIQAVLYAIATYYLWRRRSARRVYAFLLPFLTMLFLVSTTMQVAQAHLMELVFVDNKSFPGGPWSYYKQRAVGGAVNLLNVAAQLAALVLSNLFMIWRCWVIWSSVGRRMAYLVILFPSLMVIFSFITGTFLFITYAHPTSHLALLGGHNLAWVTTYYTLRFANGVVFTILILIRLIVFRHRTRAISGNGYGQEYTSVITMIIESSAAFSVIGIACLIAFGMGSPLSLLFADAATAARQITEYLIVVRLAHGRAWEEDTVTTIHFKAGEVNVSMSDSQIDFDSERMAGGKPE